MKSMFSRDARADGEATPPDRPAQVLEFSFRALNSWTVIVAVICALAVTLWPYEVIPLGPALRDARGDLWQVYGRVGVPGYFVGDRMERGELADDLILLPSPEYDTGGLEGVFGWSRRNSSPSEAVARVVAHVRSAMSGAR